MSIAIAVVVTVVSFWLVLTVLGAATSSGHWKDRLIKAGVFMAAYTGAVVAVIGLSFGLVALWGWAL